MKHVKQILALLGAVLLAALYISTLIFALSDSPLFFDLLKISVAATILLPVLLYARLSGRSPMRFPIPSSSQFFHILLH